MATTHSRSRESAGTQSSGGRGREPAARPKGPVQTWTRPPDRRARQLSARLTYELEGARGYRVSTPDGRFVGRLAWMRYGSGDGLIEALMIQAPGWKGLLSTDEHPLASELVESVSHRERRVIVSARSSETGRP